VGSFLLTWDLGYGWVAVDGDRVGVAGNGHLVGVQVPDHGRWTVSTMRDGLGEVACDAGEEYVLA
jgi:hypothetical protein